MKNKLIAGSSSLFLGLALFYMALKSDPSVSADTLELDTMSLARFQIVVAAAAILVIISFILFALAAFSHDKN